MDPEKGAHMAEARLRVHLGPNLLLAIQEHVEAEYPEEACGGLLGPATESAGVEVVDAERVNNSRADQRGRRYLIGPADVLKVEQRAEATGLQVVGYYHSHPDAPPIPSEFDRENALPWYVYLIVSVRAGRAENVRAWRLSDDRRSFEPVEIHGRSD